ncbi:glucose dehydrogenase [FAD, quinone]-like [Chironomus tepperi]|uniref:glucose dehydrogenase [FAD, quinone]-like n=1 Tax=Chironomus tepperi TaxID=113505 RepID=UPI00391F3A0A
MFLKLNILLIFIISFHNSAGISNDFIDQDNYDFDYSDENLQFKKSAPLTKQGQLPNQCPSRSTGGVKSVSNGMFQNLIHQECELGSPSLWPEDYGPTAFNNPTALNNFDFVIVGAGSAGSTLANRLSERSDWNILLLEAGGDPPIESQIPAFYPFVMNTSYTHNHFGTKSPKAGNGFKNGPYVASGKMLGGTSSVNVMLYVRGVPEDYNEWNVTGWSFNDVLPYFKKSEDNKDFPSNKYHGTNGPLSVKYFGSTPEISTVIFSGINEIGYKKLDDFNQDQHIGFVESQGTLINSERCSTARAFLSPIKNRPNLKIIKNARATHLIMNNLKVDGIKFLLRGRSMKVRARKEVILSAGAFESPKILMLSGIGKSVDLKPLNIKQELDLPVGYNLQDHVISLLNFNFLKSAPPTDKISNYFDSLYAYLNTRTGPFSGVGCFNILGFINTDNKTSNVPNIEYMHFCFLKEQNNVDRILPNLGFDDQILSTVYKTIKEAPMLSAAPILLKPKSRGTVKPRSRNIFDNPIINFNYFDHNDDLIAMVKGIKEYRKLLNTLSFKQIEISDVRMSFPECDKLAFDTNSYWLCYLKYMSSSASHPVGTCKMGEKSDSSAVVTPELKVKGIKGLRVIDASIMPSIIRGHTNAPTIMIAEKGADLIKNEYK